MARNLVPLVLAAGASSRMGRPKELLDFRGVSCLDLVLDVCAAAQLAQPILVTRNERLPLLKEHFAAHPRALTVVVNPSPELGQTSSFRVGLAALPQQARGFLLYPVDHPLVTADDVVRLIEVFARADAEGAAVDVVAPSFNHRRGHPVIVSAALAPALLALGPTDSARTVLSAPTTATRYVEFEDDRVLRDMDTPDAYQECLRRYAARPAAD